MGGPSFLRELLKGKAQEEEIAIYGPEDLKFHTDWNWLLPVWKKIGKDLFSTQDSVAMLYAINKALSEVDITAFHNLIAIHCINWCTAKQIKL
jgi:hypothetical protein